jgi:hypothetical protein
MLKKCKDCEAEKPLSEFYAHKGMKDGRLNICKDCAKAAAIKNRAAKVEYYRVYDAKRFQEDPRVKERQKAYRKTDEGKAATQRAREKWLAENPEKRAAHVILGSYVSTGRVDKPDVCSICGAGGTIDGHHHDYAKPLEVEWLCRKCHMQRHSNTETSAHEVKK